MKPCNKGPESPCKRKDNSVTHPKDSHGYQSGEPLAKEVSKRTIKVSGLFHDKCGFFLKTLDSRETSMKHVDAHIESGDNVGKLTHQCSSMNRELQHHRHFESFLDEPVPKDDSSDDDDGDDDDDDGSEDKNDTDRDNLGYWTQSGDYNAGDGGNDFDRNYEQNCHQGSSFGNAGGGFPLANYTTVLKSL